MDIKTKFGVGDYIWIAEFIHGDNIFIPVLSRIDKINISIRRYYGSNIVYFLDFLSSSEFSEDQLFATEEDCQAVCDKKNDDLF